MRMKIFLESGYYHAYRKFLFVSKKACFYKAESRKALYSINVGTLWNFIFHLKSGSDSTVKSHLEKYCYQFCSNNCTCMWLKMSYFVMH